jgi:hypothetical protein
MKLKNLMWTNAIKKNYKKPKQPKFADIFTARDQNKGKGDKRLSVLENMHTNINLSRSFLHGKNKKSLNRLKSNNLAKNITSEMRNWASNYNLRKSRKRIGKNKANKSINSKLIRKNGG